VYCQLGRIQDHTDRQAVYVPTQKVRRDLEFVDWRQVDVVTVSGSGEPTLALNLDEIIGVAKSLSGKPLMVLTNSTLLHDSATRRRLWEADRVAAKLDAVEDAQLSIINRPVVGVNLTRILDGIRALRKDGFPGILALQCMLVPTNHASVEALAELAGSLDPDEIHLNTPRRPYPRLWHLDSRGNHAGELSVPSVPLRTISLEDARVAEEIFRVRLPRARILSVYHEAPA
jgi:wyosine [tRNA(Phe)-imidazoG37] synthetase (radical SAM superfamily)